MSAKAAGSKAGRRERHLARQAELKARKKLRKARAARFAHLPGQQANHSGGADPSPRVALNIGELREMTVPVLLDMACARGCACNTKTRKADLIAMIQEKYEARSWGS